MRRLILLATFLVALPFGSYLKSAIGAQAAQSRVRVEWVDDGPPEPGVFPAQWINGVDCNAEPAIQVHPYNGDFWILRQSKCSNFEAPFLYLIFGSQRALLIDTGALGNPPVAAVVDTIVQNWKAATGTTQYELIVAHSHNHGDHIQGDGQFTGMPDTTLIPPSTPAMQQFFGFDANNWPNQIVTYDLGNRVLDIIPTPGHQNAGITFYDRRTDLLLTGDTVYPGHLFTFSAGANGWLAFKESLRRLRDFVQARPVEWVLGCHIEMTATPGVPFNYGTAAHPNEHVLELPPSILGDILDAAEAQGDTPFCEIHDDYVIHPVFVCGFGFP